MPNIESIERFLVLPDLKIINNKISHNIRYIHCEKISDFEVCPKCASKCNSIYDHVEVTIKDSPLRRQNIILKIRKRRFRCKSCRAIFREPVAGVFKGFRTTQRFRFHLMHAASTYSSLDKVREHFRCSSWLVYKAFYEQLELENRKVAKVWPRTLGIDEHSFMKNQSGTNKDFVSIFIDYNKRRVFELAMGKAIGDLHTDRLLAIEGREEVRNVIVDLSPTFRSYAKDFFPNARLIADKFHVVKLMHPLIHDLRRKVIEEHELSRHRRNPVGKLLLKYRNRLRYHEKRVIDQFLDLSEELKEVYWYLQRLYRFYRIKGKNKAREIYIKLLDDMSSCKNKKLQSYRRTLRSWTSEILNYFSTKLTNGRTEGFNRKAKLIQRCAYGFRNFENYRLKLLFHCR